MECYGFYDESNCINVGKYEGQRKNGRMEGAGTYYYANGKKHVAQWSKGIPIRNKVIKQKCGTFGVCKG